VAVWLGVAVGDCGSFGGNLSENGAFLIDMWRLAQVAVADVAVAGWQWLGGSWGRGYMGDCGSFGV
jgi:hypothetical protein